MDELVGAIATWQLQGSDPRTIKAATDLRVRLIRSLAGAIIRLEDGDRWLSTFKSILTTSPTSAEWWISIYSRTCTKEGGDLVRHLFYALSDA